jgi:acetolactate decarboxylase
MGEPDMLYGIQKTFICYIIACFIITFGISGCASTPKERSPIFQYSAINALLEGVYDSDVTVEELSRHGNFGIGTFDGLDGEMILLDGSFSQIQGDGNAYRVPETTKTPFAVITFFQGVTVSYPQSSLDFQGLTKYVDGLIPTKNIFYAIRVDGVFKFVTTRSVFKQQKPYPRLVEALKNQPEFTLKNVRGTLVGFRCPAFVGGVNVPGYHLHFITKDRSAGGHVLGFQTESVNVRIEGANEFRMILPRDTSFYNSDLTGEKRGDLDKVEKSKGPAVR